MELLSLLSVKSNLEHELLPLVKESIFILRNIYVEVDWEQKETF